MMCYLSAKEENKAVAIAIRTVCGMGTCMKHTVRKGVDVWESGYLPQSKKLPEKMPRMFCPDCSTVYHGGL